MQINEDGTARVADKIDDLSDPVGEEHPGSLEEWSYDGMVMTIRVIKAIGGGACTPDQVGIYLIRWAGADKDRLKSDKMDDPCAQRGMGLQWNNWAPISP